MFVVFDNHYMDFTSLRFAAGIRIPQRRVALEVGFSWPCGKAYKLANQENPTERKLEDTTSK